jgi:hypothetical protein
MKQNQCTWIKTWRSDNKGNNIIILNKQQSILKEQLSTSIEPENPKRSQTKTTQS